MDHQLSYYLESAAKLGAALLPIVALLATRRRLGALTTAAWLVAYGALIAGAENAGWTFWYVLTSVPPDPVVWSAHARGHAFMAAVYAVLGLGVLVGVAFTMLRTGSRLAWRILLLVAIVGGSIEAIVHGPAGLIQPHTAPPNSVTGANELFAYVVAWAAALLVSWRPIFRPDREPIPSTRFFGG